jgi:hypothetical protein
MSSQRTNTVTIVFREPKDRQEKNLPAASSSFLGNEAAVHLTVTGRTKLD